MGIKVTVTSNEEDGLNPIGTKTEQIVLTDFTIVNYNKRLDAMTGINEYLSKDIPGIELFGKINLFDKSKERLEVTRLARWTKKTAHEESVYRNVLVEFLDNNNEVYDNMVIEEGFVVNYKENFDIKSGEGEFYIFIRAVDKIAVETVAKKIENPQMTDIQINDDAVPMGAVYGNSENAPQSNTIKITCFKNDKKEYEGTCTNTGGFINNISFGKTEKQLYEMGYRITLKAASVELKLYTVTIKVNNSIGKQEYLGNGYMTKEYNDEESKGYQNVYTSDPNNLFKALEYTAQYAKVSVKGYTFDHAWLSVIAYSIRSAIGCTFVWDYGNRTFVFTYITAKQLQDFGWQVYDSATVSKINTVLKDFKIVNPNSVALFLATCAHESGYGRLVLEDGDEAYFNSNGYTTKTRGAGYIQVTAADQNSFFKYLSGKGISVNVVNGDNAQFIADYYPWEASAWEWAIQIKAMGTTINEYVNNYGASKETFIVTQYHINGRPNKKVKPGLSNDPLALKFLDLFSNSTNQNLFSINKLDKTFKNGSVTIQGQSANLPNGWSDRESCYVNAMDKFLNKIESW